MGAGKWTHPGAAPKGRQQTGATALGHRSSPRESGAFPSAHRSDDSKIPQCWTERRSLNAWDSIRAPSRKSKSWSTRRLRGDSCFRGSLCCSLVHHGQESPACCVGGPVFSTLIISLIHRMHGRGRTSPSMWIRSNWIWPAPGEDLFGGSGNCEANVESSHTFLGPARRSKGRRAATGRMATV